MLHKQSNLVSYKRKNQKFVSQRHVVQTTWCTHKKIFVKSGISKQKSMESQKDGKRGKITSFFVLKERTEIGKFMLAF